MSEDGGGRVDRGDWGGCLAPPQQVGYERPPRVSSGRPLGKSLEWHSRNGLKEVWGGGINLE